MKTRAYIYRVSTVTRRNLNLIARVVRENRLECRRNDLELAKRVQGAIEKDFGFQDATGLCDIFVMMLNDNRILNNHLSAAAEQLADAYKNNLISEQLFLKVMRELKCRRMARHLVKEKKDTSPSRSQ